MLQKVINSTHAGVRDDNAQQQAAAATYASFVVWRSGEGGPDVVGADVQNPDEILAATPQLFLVDHQHFRDRVW